MWLLVMFLRGEERAHVISIEMHARTHTCRIVALSNREVAVFTVCCFIHIIKCKQGTINIFLFIL